MRDERKRPETGAPVSGTVAMVALPIIMVICCAAGPAILAALTGGVTAWFSDLGVLGVLAVAAAVGGLVYGGWKAGHRVVLLRRAARVSALDPLERGSEQEGARTRQRA